MQAQRLRYLKQQDGSFVNKTPLILNGQLLEVVLEGLEFKIKGSNGIVLQNGSTKNNVELKKAVKTSLKNLGVQFLDELRSKKVV